MFKAVKFGKIRLGDGLQELRGANVFKLNEDFLTAAVFSRLLYMPSEAFFALLMPDCGAELGKLRESTFWPTWGIKSRSGETSCVQPDLHVEFERLDLIVEAKLNDDLSQTPRQWAREWAAWHQSEYAGAGTQPLLLGIGGFGTTDIATKATEIVEAANRLLQIDFPEVPAIQAAGLSWQELYDRLTSESWADQIGSQLVQDLREILGYFGLRRYQYLSDLVGMMRSSMISIIGPNSLDVVERWHTAEREPDWLEASRLARPISGWSVAVFSGDSMVDHDELSRALVDVRRAYRLLYLFQRRILDLLEQLAGELGQSFWYWLPSGDEEAIRGGASPFERSAWKMLPLFDASFLFLPRGVDPNNAPQNGQWLLELRLCPDDGQPEGGKGEPNPAEFADPVGCRSMIYLYAFIVQEDI